MRGENAKGTTSGSGEKLTEVVEEEEEEEQEDGEEEGRPGNPTLKSTSFDTMKRQIKRASTHKLQLELKDIYTQPPTDDGIVQTLSPSQKRWQMLQKGVTTGDSTQQVVPKAECTAEEAAFL